MVKQVRGRQPQADERDIGELTRRGLTDALRDLRPDVVANLVALTDVDQCEQDLAAAYRSNVQVVADVAAAIDDAATGSHLVSISTDQLYSGPGPHHEDAVGPINVYALSKYAGELCALKAPAATVLRTNFVGRSMAYPSKGLSSWLFTTLSSKNRLTAFSDVFFSPLDMRSLSACVARVIAQPQSGVFNLGSRGGCSKEHFAREFARICSLDASLIDSGSVATARLKAPRPGDMRMDVTRFERQFGVQLPSTSDVIEAAANEYLEHTA